MSSHHSFFSFFFIILALTHSSTSTDYLKLPLLPRNTLSSPAQLLGADLHRLSGRHTSPQSPLTSGAAMGSGQYFADLRLGSPPQHLLLVADTGSDLVWVKCSACTNCSIRRPGSAFLPRHSKTFSSHHCYDSPCQLVPHPPKPTQHCNNHTKIHTPCRYQYSYADGSTSTGFFSRETTTFNTSSNKQAKIKNLAFGCGFKISGPSITGASFNGAHGVMGLGRGPISFVSQLGRKFGNTFSYCLLDYTLSPPPKSYLTIGASSNDVVSRNVLSYTPLLTNPFSPSFYYISIESVSVNGVKLPISPSVWGIDSNGNGGTVVDSGTTLTFLAEPAYRLVLAAFRRRVTLPPSEGPFDLCVNVSGVARPRLPKLRFRLAGKSVLSPPVGNYFIDAEEGVTCLALQPVRPGSGFSVIGNLMQQGYLFEFDLDRARIGFSRHGCAVH